MRAFMSTGPAVVLAALALTSTQTAACDWSDCAACGYGYDAAPGYSYYSYYAAPVGSYYAPPVYYPRPTYSQFYAPDDDADPAYSLAPAYYSPPYLPPSPPPAYGYPLYSQPYYGARRGQVAAPYDPRLRANFPIADSGRKGITGAPGKPALGSNKVLTARVPIYATGRALSGSGGLVNSKRQAVGASAARLGRGSIRPAGVVNGVHSAPAPATARPPVGKAPNPKPSGQGAYIAATYFTGGYLAPRR
jgi:hypothetical protein